MKLQRVAILSGVRELLLGGTLVGAAGYGLTSEERKREINAVGGAVCRIGNLVTTVGTIVADYTWSMYLFPPSNASMNKVDELTSQLNTFQTNQESYTLQQWKAKVYLTLLS